MSRAEPPVKEGAPDSSNANSTDLCADSRMLAVEGPVATQRDDPGLTRPRRGTGVEKTIEVRVSP